MFIEQPWIQESFSGQATIFDMSIGSNVFQRYPLLFLNIPNAWETQQIMMAASQNQHSYSVSGVFPLQIKQQTLTVFDLQFLQNQFRIFYSEIKNYFLCRGMGPWGPLKARFD